MKWFVFWIFALWTIAVQATPMTLRSCITKGQPGDYVVVTQGNFYSMFLLRELTENRLVIEELSVEQSKINLKKVQWKSWVESQAPGVSTWTAFAIDLEKETLAQCYSFTERQWLFLDKSDQFVKQLLSLPFRPTTDNERKRVGPPPSAGEVDRRKLWRPQRVKEGQKAKNPEFDVLRTKWPSDKSKIAGSVIEMYRDISQPSFPFPYWLEIQSPHYTFKLNAVDSGSGIVSPMPSLNR